MKITAWMTSTFLGSITLKIPDRTAPNPNKRVENEHSLRKTKVKISRGLVKGESAH